MNEKLKVLELFAGIIGFSLGLERTGGFETVAFCEKDKYCQKVIRKLRPGVKIFNDVTNLKYNENVDLVTAGFPCQDISLAGEGAGLSGERSGLFWYILRTACMVGRPRLLLENVAALLNRGLCTILGALATFGYDAEWHCIPASYVGCRQLRDRVWIVADPQRDGIQRGPYISEGWGKQSREKQLARLVQPPAWPTVSSARDRGTGHGIPNGTHRNRSIGNAVVPQIPELLGYAILEAEGLK